MSPDLYAQPAIVSDLQLAFPADLGALLPPVALIPDDFISSGSNRWTRFADAWFARGFPKSGVIRRDDVDAELAFRHLSVLLGSFEPKHEHKISAVAWLASRWFADIVDPT